MPSVSLSSLPKVSSTASLKMPEVQLKISSENINQFAEKIDIEKKVETFLNVGEYPAWLNENFIQKILRKFHLDDKLSVKGLKIQQCGGKGESYASAMFRVGASFHSDRKPDALQSRSLIVKTLPQNQVGADNLGEGSYNVQAKEMEMYQNILPEFRRLLESIKEDGNIYPTVLEVDKTLEVIVLEDLMERDFVMADRFKGLDMRHVTMTLQKLARMHATSAVLLAKDPKAFDHIDTGIFTRKFDNFHQFFLSTFDVCTDEISTWDGFSTYVEKLRKLRPNFIENTLKAFDREEGDFLVVNHGDLWVNNMMFHYDGNGCLSDSVLIDFQFSFVGSPALDLIYFLMTSSLDELRYDKFEELTQFYYYELKDILTRFDYDMKKLPTLHAFQLQVQRKYFFAIVCCFAMVPIMKSENKDADIELLMGTDERASNFKRQLYKNAKVQEVLKKMLPKFDTKGVLDEM